MIDAHKSYEHLFECVTLPIYLDRKMPKKMTCVCTASDNKTSYTNVYVAQLLLICNLNMTFKISDSQDEN